MIPRCLCVLFCVSLFFAPATFADEQDATPARPWTILLYGAVDNSADDPFVQFTDRVRHAIDDDPGVELVMFIDRSKDHDKRPTYLGEDFSGSRLYRIRKDAVERLGGGDLFPEITADNEVHLNAADATILKKFIAWGKSHFPAQHYALLIYSHANGKVMCPDDGNQDDMGIAELTDKLGVEERVDFLALELCNMAGAEIAYQWRPGNGAFEADALVAIPNAGPPLDWHRAFGRIRSPGHAPLEGTPVDPATMTALDFGNLVIEEGHRGREAAEKRDGRPSSESAACYDLHKAGEVKVAVDALARALDTSNARDALFALRSENDLIRYSADGSFVDLYDLARRISQNEEFPKAVRSAANKVMDHTDELVVTSFGMSAYKNFEPNKNGVFIVLPSGRPGCWKHYRWYTPENAPDPHYGNWLFLRDGASPGNDAVRNWYELLERWCSVIDKPERTAVPADIEQEKARLQGTWSLVAMEQLGEQVRAEDFDGIKLKIDADQWTLVLPEHRERNTVVINPATDPKSFDMTTFRVDSEEESLGIYKLDGDTLTLCRSAATGDVTRPQAFTTTDGASILLVWKRIADQ